MVVPTGKYEGEQQPCGSQNAVPPHRNKISCKSNKLRNESGGEIHLLNSISGSHGTNDAIEADGNDADGNRGRIVMNNSIGDKPKENKKEESNRLNRSVNSYWGTAIIFIIVGYILYYAINKP